LVPSSSTSPSATSSTPFLVHFVSVSAPLDSEFKTLRAKLALFLQGSTGYDLSAIQDRIEAEAEEHFLVERAIVYGKVRNEVSCLEIFSLISISLAWKSP